MWQREIRSFSTVIYVFIYLKTKMSLWQCDRGSATQWQSRRKTADSYTLGSFWVAECSWVSVKERDLKIPVSKSTVSHLFPLHVPEWPMKRDCFLARCQRTHSALSYDNLCHLWVLWNLWQLNSDCAPTRRWYLFLSNREFISQGFTASLVRRSRGRQTQRKWSISHYI